MMTTDPINNAFAIEFDKILNQNSSGVNDNLDFDDYSIEKFKTSDSSYLDFVTRQLKENHISWGYPGDRDIYKSDSTNYYYYYLRHRRLVKNGAYLAGYDEFTIPIGSKADPKLGWRHIKIKYKASTSTLTYIYNDKYIDGTPKRDEALNSDNITLDRTKFTNNRAYWGFTAATGSPKSMGQDLAIVMEKMPAVADVTPSVLLTDITKNTTSADNNKVAATDGDDLKFDYSLKYNGGLDSSGDLKTTIALPKNVDYDGDDSGVIGKIIYKDADGATAEKEINKSELKDVTITVPGKNVTDSPTYKTTTGLELTIPSLTNIGDVHKVEIYGKAHAPESTDIQTTTVAGAHANFVADNYVGDIMSPEFTINNEKLQITNDNSLNQELTVDDTVHFTGSATYLKGTKFNGDTVKANVKVYDEDGKSINADMIGDIDIASGATVCPFNIAYSLNGLAGGKTYTFKVSLSDTTDHVSNTLVYTVKAADTKKLLIEKKIKYLDYTVVERNETLTLTTAITYDDKSAVKPADITTYLQVDDETPISGSLSTTQTSTSLSAQFDIKSNSLSVGEHKIKIYATDGRRTSDVVVYDFKVIEHGLILTPDKETIEVRNNDPVNLGWNVKYGSEVDDKTVRDVNLYKAELKIKSEGDDDFHDFYFLADDNQNELVNKIIAVDGDGNFDFDVNPCEYNQVVPASKNSYLDQLKEGRNEIKFQVSGGGLTSEEKTVIVNVPKLTPVLTSPRKIVHMRRTSSTVYIPVQFEYKEDSTYTTKLGQIPIKVKADNGNVAAFQSDQDTLEEGPPMTFNAKGLIRFLNLSTTQGPQTVHLSVANPYGRKGEDYDLILSFLTKILKLEVSNNCEFRDIDFHDKKNDYISRQGNWKIAVDSLGAKWNLQAQSNGLFNEKASSYSEPLVFLNKDGLEESLTDNPLIAQKTTSATVQDEVDDVTEGWKNDDGILLKNSMPNLAGDYNGQIEWTLTEAP